MTTAPNWDQATQQKARDAFSAGDVFTTEKLLTSALQASIESGILLDSLVQDILRYATLFCMWRRYTDAERLYRKLLKASEVVLGPNHPDTIDLMEKLAVVLRETTGAQEAMHLLFMARSRALAEQRHPA